MHTPYSLRTCLSVVHRKIVRHLAPYAIAKCQYNTYANLQRGCNAEFASEVRSIMKHPLQVAQAAQAATEYYYVLANPQIRHNPHYLPLLSDEELAYIFAYVHNAREGSSFSKIFMAKYSSNEGQALNVGADQYILNDAIALSKRNVAWMGMLKTIMGGLNKLGKYSWDVKPVLKMANLSSSSSLL
ncbi:hypothetical protein HK097_006116 [Rhizophlyctis rosea]|uniref:Uncharacterized protein n=1 Tax=Rhizophlyctis rosea TaxID=64517 RepID=A0AAD5SCV2_9FUNG|nr:hypothetical protein HK097_006116 [Rhizophlyctis rosea]